MKIKFDKKVLFVFTMEYPFSSGETFFESEICYLAKKYHRIVIISSDLINKQTRNVPKNVILFRNNIEINWYSKIISLLGFFSFPVLTELFNWGKLKIPFKRSNINYMLISYFKSKKNSNYIEKLRKELNVEKSQLYLYSYWWMDEAIGIARYHKKNPEVRCFTRAHGYDLYFDRTSFGYLPFKKYTFENLNAVFLISEHGLNYLQETLKLNNGNKAFVSRLGTEKQQINSFFLNKDDEFVIVSCSHIYPNKRVETIAKCLKLITDKKIRWIHFGEFIESITVKYKKDFHELIESLRANKNISVELLGLISNADLMKFYSENKVDLFINVSESEGIPVSIMEAMSFGIPVIATNVGGVSEIVNCKNGELVPKDISSESLAKKILSFVNMSEDQTKIKKKFAYNTWNAEYNAEINYEKFTKQIELL